MSRPVPVATEAQVLRGVPVAPLVVAWGAGLNSTALVVGFVERGVRPDLILFADTGGEKPQTYDYLDAFRGYLGREGFPDLVVVRKPGRTLEEDCLDNEFLPSLAYGFKSCSDKYKIRPQDAYVSRWEPAIRCWDAGGKVRKAIGYDAGPRDRERARIRETRRYAFEYPLIAWGWDRPACERAVVRSGLLVPEKSACFFCPATKKHELVELARRHPDLTRRAVEMEAVARPNLETVKGLGRSWSWGSFLAADAAQRRLFDDPPPLECVCFEGGDR